MKTRIEGRSRKSIIYVKSYELLRKLGDVSDSDKDADAIRKRLEENPYPQAIKNKVLDELSRYEMLPAASGETGVIKTYIDWLMDLPWWQDLKIMKIRMHCCQ